MFFIADKQDYHAVLISKTCSYFEMLRLRKL